MYSCSDDETELECLSERVLVGAASAYETCRENIRALDECYDGLGAGPPSHESEKVDDFRNAFKGRRGEGCFKVGQDPTLLFLYNSTSETMSGPFVCCEPPQLYEEDDPRMLDFCNGPFPCQLRVYDLFEKKPFHQCQMKPVEVKQGFSDICTSRYLVKLTSANPIFAEYDREGHLAKQEGAPSTNREAEDCVAAKKQVKQVVEKRDEKRMVENARVEEVVEISNKVTCPSLPPFPPGVYSVLERDDFLAGVAGCPTILLNSLNSAAAPSIPCFLTCATATLNTLLAVSNVEEYETSPRYMFQGLRALVAIVGYISNVVSGDLIKVGAHPVAHIPLLPPQHFLIFRCSPIVLRLSASRSPRRSVAT